MEEFILNTFSTALLCGVIFLIAAGISYFYPPAKINSLYGYRTALSMKSQEHWDYAQKVSASYMFRASSGLIAFSLTGVFFPWPEHLKSGIGLGSVVLMIIVFITGTEKAVKKRFPES